MTQMIDAQTGHPVDVPETAVADGIATGLYGFAPGQRVNIVGPDGAANSIDAAEVPTALQGGYQLEGASQSQERLTQEKYGEGVGNELKAAAEGAARGLSFGLSDQMLTKGGFSSPEALRERKERNEASSIGGEVIGNVAPMLLSGGGSLLGTGAKVAGSGVRSIATAGHVAEGIAATMVGKALGKGALTRIASKAAGSAVEGLAYGAGQAISEAALGDTDLTAEKLLAGAGVGAVIGGSAAGLFGLGGEGVRLGGRRLAEGVSGTTSRLSESIENLYRNATGAEPAKGLGEKYARFASVVSGGDEAAIKKLVTDKAARAVALSGDEAIEQGSRRMAQIENRSDEILNELADQGRGANKLEEITKIVRKDNASEAYAASGDIIGNIRGRLEEMKADPAAFGNKAAIARAERVLNKLDERLSKLDLQDPKANGILFHEIDNGKRELQKLAAQARKSTMFAPERETYEEINAMQEQFRTHLEDDILWGKAGAVQKEVNSKWAPFLGNQKYAGNNFTVKIGEEAFDPKYQHEPGRYLGFFKQLTSPNGDLDYQFLTKRQQTRGELLESLQKNFADDPAFAKKVAEAKALDAESKQILAKTRDDAVLKNQFKQLAGGDNTLGAAAGAIGGGMLAGPLGALAGAAVGAASQPARLIRQLASIDRIQSGISNKIKTGVGSYLKKAAAGVRSATDSIRVNTKKAGDVASHALAPLSILQSTHFGDATQRQAQHKDRNSAAQQHARDIAAFVQDPQRAADRIGRSTASLAGVAPSVAAAIGQKSMVAANFLASKAPKDPNPPNPLIKRDWKPPESQLAKFARYVEAVEDPMSTLDRMHEGTLTSESVEALQAVYPQLYGELVGEVMQQMSEKPASYGYGDRVQLSLLLNQPLDPTMQPDFIATAQQRWATGAQQQGQPPSAPAGKVSSAGVAKFSLGSSMKTHTQETLESMHS